MLVLAAGSGDKETWVCAGTSLKCARLSNNSFVLFPELKFIFCQIFNLERYVSNTCNNLFKENLQNRMGPCVLTAEFCGLLDKIIILCRKLVFLWLTCLSSRSWGSGCYRLHILWSRCRNKTLAYKLIDIIHDVVNVVIELFWESDKLLGQLRRQV